jgi:hypothetical protein
MRAQYDSNQPIKSSIDKIEDAIALAAPANAASTSTQIVAIVYNTVFSTGMFSDTCREWRQCTGQSWVNFKEASAIAHQEY